MEQSFKLSVCDAKNLIVYLLLTATGPVYIHLYHVILSLKAKEHACISAPDKKE